MATQAVERHQKARYRLHNTPEGHAASSYQKLELICGVSVKKSEFFHAALGKRVVPLLG
jgi:hypothetical protein